MPPDGLLALLGIGLIAAVAWLGGALMEWIRQPRIAGEMTAVFAAAALLGGQIADVASGQRAGGRIGDLFPEAAVTVATVAGGLGLILYMLLVGISIDPAPMREHSRAIGLVVVATIVSMTALALAVGPLLVDAGGWKPASTSDGAFVLALAAALSAVGVPIVARILEGRGEEHSVVGGLVIVAAACVTLLALIGSAVAIDGGDAAAGGRIALRVAAAAAVLVGALMLAGRRRVTFSPAAGFAIVVVLAVGSGLAGDELLSSLLIGPLVVGIALRKESPVARAIARSAVFGAAVRGVLLPVFLGVAALHTDLGALGSGAGALQGALAITAAVIALKFAVGIGAARLAGFARGEARALGALLQCGGIMTIAISLDLQSARVIDARMHATLTLVGLVTTLATGPLMRGTALAAVGPGARGRVPLRSR